jgi:hypothetical protein
MSWTWSYLDTQGAPVSSPEAASVAFPTQSDAESWIGESWRELLETGVEQVSLLEDERVVYGPMSLRPAG